MKVLGIDPGLVKTGWSILQNNNQSFVCIASGTIKTDAKQDISQRLKNLHEKITEVIKKYQPSECSIEKTFLNKNPLSSLKLGHARGALILSSSIAGLSIFEYSATEIKKTVTGAGRADKNQVATMINYLIPSANCQTEDENDALATAFCHFNFSNFRKNLTIY